MEETILACLAKEPENRPQSAGEVAARLEVAGSVAKARIQAAIPRHEPSDLLPGEFVVTVDPFDAGARVWLGPASNVEVKDGQAVVKNLSDGEQELTVQAEGYQPFTTLVTVKDGRGRAEVRLVAIKGAIAVKARPGTVVTAVNGRGGQIGLGTVPAGGVLTSNNLLTVGVYTLKLAHADCAPVEMPGIELVIGRAIRVAPAQVLLPAELRVFSVPTGAEVRVNGVVAGSTPATIRNQPCELALELEVFLHGYRRVGQTVTLKPKEIRSVNVGTLTAESGGIELRIGKCGSSMGVDLGVAVDGRQIQTEQTIPGMFLHIDDLEVGSRTVEVTHPDYEPWRQAVAVLDQATTAVNVELDLMLGTVACETTPAGARVVINGGNQPRPRLTAGQRRRA